jgi:putative ABC transport system permease protein
LLIVHHGRREQRQARVVMFFVVPAKKSLRESATFSELFGVLALILACIGMYGVTAYTVEQRTHEIGIRMALGAGRSNILVMVLRNALVQVAFGLAIGIAGALVGGNLLANLLYGVKNYDPMIVGLAAIVLVISSLLAASIPACRASGIDPLDSLHYE